MRRLKRHDELQQFIRRQGRLLQFLQETVADILNRRDVMDLLETILRRAAELIGTSTGCVLLVNEAKTERIRVIATGAASPFLGSCDLIDSGAAGEVWQTGKVVVINNYKEWANRRAVICDVVEAVAYFPLKYHDEIIGIIGLWHTEPGMIFDRYDIQELEHFASLASIAYTNAYLHREAQKEILERKQSEKLQQALYRISETANSAFSLEELYRSLHQIINELIPAKNLFISIYDDQENMLHFPYWVDERRTSFPSRPLGKKRADYVLRTGKPLIVNSDTVQQLTEQGELVMASELSDEWLGVPLKNAGDKVFGVLAVQTYDKDVHYTQEHSHILAFVSNQVAMAIERKKAEEGLRYLSSHDALTGIYNRAYLNEQLKRLEHCVPLSIVICDLDGLKLVNDTLGHIAGDKMLIAAARLLTSVLGADDIAVRLGGDEFALLLPGADRDTADVVYRRIRHRMQDYNKQAVRVPLSLSLGFAARQHLGQSLHELFKEADSSMYREKLHHSRSARSAIVKTVMTLLEARDFITEGHAERMQDLSAALAHQLGLSELRISDIRLFAQFHDIGKVGIADQILFKPGPLTKEEKREMERHAEIGYRIAQSSPELIPIADWILKHHEWWNGKGYPLGLHGAEIPLECRILAIIDAYDAMTSDRPYRKAMSHDCAMAELKQNAGIQFDPALVRIFLNLPLFSS